MSDDAQTDAQNLLPCPFCKGIGQLTTVSGGWCVECDDCRARGPKVILAGGALGGWNHRAAVASPRATGSLKIDWQRICAWALKADRQPASLAFTAGDERQIAYALEHRLASPSLASATAGESLDRDTLGAVIAWDLAQSGVTYPSYVPSIEALGKHVADAVLKFLKASTPASPPVPESPSALERAARICDAHAKEQSERGTNTVFKSYANVARECAARIRALGESPSPVPEQKPE